MSGLLCDVELMLQERRGYGIPADAIMARGKGREVIFAMVDGKAEMIEVKRGIVEPYYAELIGGEKIKNKQIIVSGHTFVNGGDKVIANRTEK